MERHDDFPPAERDRLEQELLELHFGCHEDPATLQARLDREPALQALQREVLRQASLLEVAVRPEQPRLDLPAVTPPTARRARWWRSPLWRLAAAAALAVVVVGIGYAVERQASTDLDRYESTRLHVTLSAPQAVPVGAPWSFTVQTADLRGRPADCRVSWRALGSGDSVLAAGEAPVQAGRAVVAMAAATQLPNRLEVVADHATDRVTQLLPLQNGVAGPLVHLTTDRPVYRPGEPVYVRAVQLDRLTLVPTESPQPVRFQLFDAKGAPVDGAESTCLGGVAATNLVVPPDSAGGEHRVEVSSPGGDFAAEAIAVVVRPFRNPRLQTRIDLDRASYAPGARGSATVRSERLGAGPAAGAAVRGVVVLDGAEVWTAEQPLDGQGVTTFRFTVPQAVTAGAARFVATVTDGGVVETELEPFLVPNGKVLVAAFPEGGDLVAGVENRVYLECTDPLGRFVDTGGALVDDRGERLLRWRTEHQGRTRLTFVPRAGRSYRLELADQAESQPLPPVVANGLALRLPADEVAAGAPVRIQIAGRGNGPWLCGVFCRGALVGQTTLRAEADGELMAIAEVPLPASVAGVLRVTVFDRQMQPVAERLLRRAQAQRLTIDLACEHAALTPGALQQVTVRTQDAAGRPVPAVVGIQVVDAAVRALGSEPAIGLFDHAGLFADVEKTEQLGDFLHGDPAGARNADLLLGTRGWRKFVWRNDATAQAAIAAHGPFAANLLAREGFAQAPQVLSNLEAARATTAGLRQAARHAERRLERLAGAGLVGWVVLGLIELLLAVARAARAGIRWPLVTTVTAACSALLLLPSLQGDAMPPAAAVADFAAAEPRRVLFEQWRRGAPPEPIAELLEDLQDQPKLLLGGGVRVAGGDLGVIPADRLEQAEEAKKMRQGRAGFFRDEVGFRLPRGTPVRRYAHRHTVQDDRRDFTPTILWDPALITDANGIASVQFATSDAVTTWAVTADAHVVTGQPAAIGQAATTFRTRLPFHIECVLPDEVAAGDRLILPISAVVDGEPLAEVALEVSLGEGLQPLGELPTRLLLQNGRGRALLPCQVTDRPGNTSLTIAAVAGRFTDRLRHNLPIAARGFPHQRSVGGSLAAGVATELTVALPLDALPGTGRAQLKVFPSPFTALTEGLQGILREPCGCFEQASSSNYPNTMVLALLEATGDDVPALAARARELLPRGYAKITGYECRERGYEWFGGDPGHEALTAYGLLQFHDMAAVHPVDAGMVERTRAWLLARRDGKGGFQRNARALDRFGGAPQPTTDAYVVYALLQSGVPAAELARELDTLQGRAGGDDAYEVALIALAMHLAGRQPTAATARARLATLQLADGSLRGLASITRSGGRDLQVETTGFAVLAWLQGQEHPEAVRRAVAFLQGARDAGGTFGATQATIVALQALTRYAQQNRATKAPGTLRIRSGLRLLAETSFAAGSVEAITVDLWPLLVPGDNPLHIELEGGGGNLPWALDVAYHAERPADDPNGKVAVRTTLRDTSVREGATVALDIEVENRTADGLPMTMAIVGLPAGLSVPTKVLEDLQRAQAFAFWELRGREVALYWRDLEPEGKRRVSLDCTARVPGRTIGAASRAYLYYTPGEKRWAAPLAIEVQAR